MNLGKTNKYQQLIRQLYHALRSDDLAVRLSSADKLAKIGWKPSTKEEQVYYFIAGLMWSELIRMGEAAVNPLLERIDDEDFFVRKFSVDSLGDIQSASAVQPLIKILNSKFKGAKNSTKTAKHAFGNLMPTSSKETASKVASPVSSDYYYREDKHYGTIDLGKKYDLLRTSAALALGKIGSNAAVKHLLAALNDKCPEVRDCAFKSICKINKGAVSDLVDALNGPDLNIKNHAVRALGIINDPNAVEPLIGLLDDPAPSIREATSETLGIIRDDRATDPLIKLLKDPELFVREAAAKALGRIGSEQAVIPLIKAFDDADAFVRTSIVKALGALGDSRAIILFLTALKDEDKWVRRAAVSELKTIDGSLLIEPIIDALKDESETVQEAAVNALSDINDANAINSLIGILKSGKTGKIRERVAKVLKDMPIQKLYGTKNKTDTADPVDRGIDDNNWQSKLKGNFDPASS